MDAVVYDNIQHGDILTDDKGDTITRRIIATEWDEQTEEEYGWLRSMS